MTRPTSWSRAHRATGGVLLASVASLMLCTTASAQPRTRVSELVKRPLTPGSVALLVEHTAAPEARARLVSALTDSRPEVRAAAGRVVFAAGLVGLIPSIKVTLQGETEKEPAMELARALVYLGGSGHDADVLEAARRVSDTTLTSLVIAAQRAEGLGALPRLKALKIEPLMLARFVEEATRTNRDAIGTLADEAIRTRDVVQFAIAAEAARLSRYALTPAALVAALGESAEPALRSDALWYTLQTTPSAMAVSEDVRASVARLVDTTADPPSDPRLLIGIVLAARALSLPPRFGPQWQAFMARPTTEARPLLMLPGIAIRLTPEERQVLGLPAVPLPPRAGGPGSRGAAPLPRSGGPGARGPVPAAADARLFRTAFGYPTKYVTSVFAEAGCDLAKAQKEGAGGGAAQLTMRDDGRVARVSLVDTDASGPCSDAVRALLMTYAMPADARRADDNEQLVMVPITADYAACQDSALSTEPVPGQLVVGIEPPKKIKDVKPIYPKSAQSARVSGVVIAEARISSTGCVYSAQILRSADPRLDWAALHAVTAWAFTPMRVNGAPTPIVMTVTVSFTLN